LPHAKTYDIIQTTIIFVIFMKNSLLNSNLPIAAKNGNVVYYYFTYFYLPKADKTYAQ